MERLRALAARHGVPFDPPQTRADAVSALRRFEMLAWRQRADRDLSQRRWHKPNSAKPKPSRQPDTWEDLPRLLDALKRAAYGQNAETVARLEARIDRLMESPVR